MAMSPYTPSMTDMADEGSDMSAQLGTSTDFAWYAT